MLPGTQRDCSGQARPPDRANHNMLAPRQRLSFWGISSPHTRSGARPHEPATGQGRLRPRIRLIPCFTQFGPGSLPSNSNNISTGIIDNIWLQVMYKDRSELWTLDSFCSCSPSSSSLLSLTLVSFFLNDLVSLILFYSIDLVSFIRIPSLSSILQDTQSLPTKHKQTAKMVKISIISALFCTSSPQTTQPFLSERTDTNISSLLKSPSPPRQSPPTPPAPATSATARASSSPLAAA